MYLLDVTGLGVDRVELWSSGELIKAWVREVLTKACRIIVSAPVPWIFDSRFKPRSLVTWRR